MSSFHPSFEEKVKSDSFLGESLLNALNTLSPVSLRKNPLKTIQEFANEKPVEWCKDAFYLPERISYTLEPLFHAGCFYPQEAGSMLLDHVLRSLPVPEIPKILDLCAAPGGKSTLIASYLKGSGLLVSNEVINQRAKILKENLTKWGVTNCIVTNNDPSEFDRLSGYFDVVVVDAPCSGEGMFRKDKDARSEWSPENVALCSGRQKRILSDSWKCIAENGFLIYSTCTFNESENEQNVEWLLSEFDAELISIKMPVSIKSGRRGIGYYGIPGISETEGFFIAVIQKKGVESVVNMKKAKGNLTILKDLTEVEKFCHTESNTFFQWQDKILAVPEELEQDSRFIQSNFHIVKLGTMIGEISRKGIIPSHDLAMNPGLLNYEDRIELSRQEALRYLHGDTFSLEGKHGYQILTYKNEPLGWIKHLGNRFNNLYPKEWRIRMDVG